MTGSTAERLRSSRLIFGVTRRFCPDGGAEHWAIIASLVETCKINDVDPLAYLTDALTRIVNGHPNSDVDQLLPWAYRGQPLKAVA